MSGIIQKVALLDDVDPRVGQFLKFINLSFPSTISYYLEEPTAPLPLYIPINTKLDFRIQLIQKSATSTTRLGLTVLLMTKFNFCSLKSH